MFQTWNFERLVTNVLLILFSHFCYPQQLENLSEASGELQKKFEGGEGGGVTEK